MNYQLLPQQTQKMLTLCDNLIRYSTQQANEGSYLNAVLILRKTRQDLQKKLQQRSISSEEIQMRLKNMYILEQRYIQEGKCASPRKYNYDERMEEKGENGEEDVKKGDDGQFGVCLPGSDEK